MIYNHNLKDHYWALLRKADKNQPLRINFKLLKQLTIALLRIYY
jgi:hypothetical protein